MGGHVVSEPLVLPGTTAVPLEELCHRVHGSRGAAAWQDARAASRA